MIKKKSISKLENNNSALEETQNVTQNASS